MYLVDRMVAPSSDPMPDMHYLAPMSPSTAVGTGFSAREAQFAGDLLGRRNYSRISAC